MHETQRRGRPLRILLHRAEERDTEQGSIGGCGYFCNIEKIACQQNTCTIVYGDFSYVHGRDAATD